MWPLSRRASPKQALRFVGEESLFQGAVKRLEGIFPPERVLVVTISEQAALLQEQCPKIPSENYLIEPMPRGTSSVVGLAAVALQHRDPQAVMAVLTADHFIGNEDRFRQLLLAALDVACDGYLVTLGIAPTFPSTGYGYIQRGEYIGIYRDLEVYRALRFKEKPDEVQAVVMVEAGDHAWNSGMFVWKVEHILKEFGRQMPVLTAALNEISQGWNTSKRNDILSHIWPTIEPETIDYGIMEGARNVAIIPAEGLNWSDVGSWDSLFDLLPRDENGNISVGGKHIGLDTHNSLVYVNQENRLVVTIGVEGLVVVDTDDVLLVCPKDQAQKVRQVVNKLKQVGQEYL